MIPLHDLKNKRIVVIGDLIIDHYRMMSPKRLSPEAPVPILVQDGEEYRPGGASNVVANLSALGVGSVAFITVVGNDNYPALTKKFTFPPCHPVLVHEIGRLTTVKERILTLRQQVCRIDHQSERPIGDQTVKLILEETKEIFEETDAIIFSDYNHGVCKPILISPLMDIATKKGIPTIVDSKAKDTLSKYMNATIAVPNLDEAKSMLELAGCQVDFSDPKDIARRVRERMGLKAAAITLGPGGILLAEADGACRTFPALDRNAAVDVTGAGDTVTAVVAAAITLSLPYDTIMTLANVAAGIKVRKLGVATVTPEEISQHIWCDATGTIWPRKG